MKIVIVVLAFLVGGFYFLSDPFRAHVDEVYENQTAWTDERILSNPQLFLRDAERQIREAEGKLRAQRLSFATQLEGFKRKEASDRQLKSELTAKLSSLKKDYQDIADKGYQTASADGFSQEQMKSLIIQAHTRIQSLSRREGAYATAKLSAEAKIASIDKHLSDISLEYARLSEIQDQISIALAGEDVSKLVDTVNAVVDSTLGLEQNLAPDQISIEDILALDRSPNDDQLFDEIMSTPAVE